MSTLVGVASTSTSPLANVNSNFINTMLGINPSLSFTPTLKHSIFSAKIVNREVFHATDWVIDIGAMIIWYIPFYASLQSLLL